MSKETKKKMPKWRFPEFVNDGKWEVKPLSEILDYERPDNYIVTDTNYLKEGIPVLTANKSFVLGYTKEDYGIYRNLPAIIFDDFTVDNKFVDFPFKVKSSAIKILKTKGNNDLRFIYELISQIKYDAKEHKRYYISEYQNINVLVPDPKEQKKIAYCLSSLDEIITANNQKLNTLKVYKKGLMQNLFPQEGETEPKYRFPEFVNDGEWVENTLDEVATFLKGKGISKSDIVENGSLPCIRYGELYTHYKETIGIIKSYTNLNAEDLVLSRANDVIIPASGETQIDIATASCVLEKGIALGGDLNIIRTKINGVFLSYYLNNIKRMDIAQMAQGISVVHLYPNQLKTLIINIPKPKEQQKIASCISSLDDLITAQADKIEQLKLHKKGLMQGLFPKIND